MPPSPNTPDSSFRAAAAGGAFDVAAALAQLKTDLTAEIAAGRTPKPSSRGGGGSGSPTHVSGSSSPLTFASALYTAFPTAPPFSLLPDIIAPGTDSRSLSITTQRRLSAHRLFTSQHTDDFENEWIGSQLLLKPSSTKGMSFFVVLSDDVGVIAAAHAWRCSVTKQQKGCARRLLFELPDSLTLTFDRVLNPPSAAASPVMMWHASLTPKVPMPFHVFLGMVDEWQPVLCSISGAANCPPEIFFDPGELHTMSSFLEPYFSSKLLALVNDSQRMQPAGGSPGT